MARVRRFARPCHSVATRSSRPEQCVRTSELGGGRGGDTRLPRATARSIPTSARQRPETHMLHEMRILSDAGLLVTLVPLPVAWNVITRSKSLGLRPFFRVHAKQLLIMFNRTESDAARKLLSSCLHTPSAVDNSAPTNQWIVGHLT